MKALEGAPGTSPVGGRGDGSGGGGSWGAPRRCQVTLTSEIITPIEPAGHGMGVCG